MSRAIDKGFREVKSEIKESINNLSGEISNAIDKVNKQNEKIISQNEDRNKILEQINLESQLISKKLYDIND